eukprot:8254682-Pyramimonas_sp.AAC.1
MRLGAGRNRRRTSGKGRRRNPKHANGETMECDIRRSAQHFRRESPQGAEAGVRQYIWSKATPTCTMLTGGLF